MIEVVAELSRGPVFLAGEALECVVTVTNPLPPTATSASSEALAWASAQIHCQFHASESRVALPPPDSNQPDVQPESQTVFLPHRGERGQCILSTPPKILFCDLRLEPGESKSYSYSEVLPIEGPPSFRGQSVKYVYKLTIGCQRVNSPITLLRVPLRVLVLTGLQDVRFPQDEAVAPSSPFLEEDEGGKKDSWLAELAGERLMAATSCRSLLFSKFADRGACTARVPAAPRGRGCPLCVPCDSCPTPGVLPSYNQNQLLPPHPSQLHPRLLHCHCVPEVAIAF
uniref:RGP1-like protein, RAB6A GEF complex partner 1 n=1 Tax=Myotis myotis TaxID=51298 RepID=A0A7J7URC1_MYOMY|nr:RGP1-like protein, RAB6A GEF complex partner 1 [Myotis myotis]